jgi:hypothetical protein
MGASVGRVIKYVCSKKTIMKYFIIKTNKFIPKRFSAFTFGPFILIRPNMSNNVSLIEHEKVHVKQWWSNPLMGIFYLASKKYRYKYELEAHRVQLTFNKTFEYANFLTNNLYSNYKLTIDKQKIYQDLIEGILK